MTRDVFDDLLDRSAPASRPPAADDLDAMIAEARQPAPHGFRPRILVASGLAVVLAFGGVGVAAATDGFSWAPWAQDPIGAVQFTMTNGLDCELRWSEYTGGDDPEFVGEVNSVLEDWYRSADVLAEVEPFVPETLDGLGPIELQPGETLDTLPPGEAENRAWALEWSAWDIAVSDAEWRELERHGIRPGDARLAGTERNGQIQCFDENRDPFVPGAGS